MMRGEFPKMMQHPAFRRGEVHEVRGVDQVSGRVFVDQRGMPDYLPNVEVNTEDQEAEYRAKGYLAMGETMPKHADFVEFPKMMTHPGHVDATPQTIDARLNASGQVERLVIPGIPEKYPPVTANSNGEETAWLAKGYVPGGIQNKDAFVTSKSAPSFLGGYKPKEWPKMINGVEYEDPEAEARMLGQALPVVQPTDRSYVADASPFFPREPDPEIQFLKQQLAAILARLDASAPTSAPRNQRTAAERAETNRKAKEWRDRRKAAQKPPEPPEAA